jgi:hypothetical protein
MLARTLCLISALLFCTNTLADVRDLIDEDVLSAIAREVSGEAAKRNLDTITLQHRMRSGAQFDVATQHIYDTLRHYGLDEVEFLNYAADGETMYGTQRSRPLWVVESAQLWEVSEEGGRLQRVRKVGDWDAVPLSLAQDSLSADVTALLVDIGAGTDDADYAGKDLGGKLVLTSSQPEAVAERAVGELGAVGIISYAPNQRSAWWKEDDRLVRWGHLDSFPETRTFGFMVSLGEARKLQSRLAAGGQIPLRYGQDRWHRQGR